MQISRIIKKNFPPFLIARKVYPVVEVIYYGHSIWSYHFHFVHKYRASTIYVQFVIFIWIGFNLKESKGTDFYYVKTV